MEMMFKKYRPLFVTAALVPVLTLSGCGNSMKETVDEEIKTTQEATTEASTQAEIASANDAQTQLDNNSQVNKEFHKETIESFETYKEFYTKTQMAYMDEEGKVNIDRIDNVFKVINGEVADLSSDEVSSAIKNIEWMVYPEYVGKKINFTNTGGIDSIQDEEEIVIYATPSAQNPHLSQYLTNEDAKTAAINYETIMDKVIAELNELDEDGIPKNTVSDETISQIKELMIKNENEYKIDIDHINDDTTSVGQKLVENIYYEKLIELYANITGELTFGEFYINKNGQQAEAESAYITRFETMTDEEKAIYNDYHDHYLGKDYISYICEAERILSDYAEDNSNVHSKIDVKELNRQSMIEFYKNQKETLLSIKEQYPDVAMTLHC